LESKGDFPKDWVLEEFWELDRIQLGPVRTIGAHISASTSQPQHLHLTMLASTCQP